MTDGELKSITLELSEAKAGHHMLVSRIKDRDGNLQDQQTLDFMLVEPQTPPTPGDYDFVFPNGLKSTWLAPKCSLVMAQSTNVSHGHTLATASNGQVTLLNTNRVLAVIGKWRGINVKLSSLLHPSSLSSRWGFLFSSGYLSTLSSCFTLPT